MNPPDQPPQNPNPQPPPPPAPLPDIMQEVRFAVVMYGGVSLAIYINGVAQQLLDMVRATAVGLDGKLQYDDEKLSVSGKIYRRTAKFLNRRPADDSFLRTDDPTAPVRTKFIVDVISGTSAGGLNGIFLGKALANDQSLTALQNLWMAEGDLGRLLNDEESVRGEDALDAKKIKQPQSLLNSQRMYDKLLTALHTMDFPNGGQHTLADAVPEVGKSPLVEELDVFVTTTDIAGLPIHIKLTNTVADELRHRNVFRFRYCTAEATGEKHDDFGVKFNPFLAFAGRCTSSFPFAFEPMRFDDIWDVLASWTTYRGYKASAEIRDDWKHLYKDYTDGGHEFEHRSFGDGGYLDNKPFTFATRTLMRRRALRPVSRKLLYIEPAPHPVKFGNNDGERPNVIANVLAALFKLPRYETIHGDLETIIERNRMFRQLGWLMEEIDKDVQNKPAMREEDGTRYENTPLHMLVERHGVFYGTYHRLKVDEVTCHLASTIAIALGFDPESDEYEALRLILATWREENYKPGDRKEEDRPDGRRYDSHFLLSFDIGYRQRRLFFIQSRINALAGNSANEAYVRELHRIKAAAAEAAKALRIAEHTLHRDSQLTTLLAAAINGAAGAEPDAPLDREAVRKTLIAILRNPESAAEIARHRDGPIGNIAEHIRQFLERVFKDITRNFRRELPDIPAQPPAADGAPAAQQEIARLYREFEWYDMVIFPMQQGTDSAESRHVDILRISPLDAANLIREPGQAHTGGMGGPARTPDAGGTPDANPAGTSGRRKLAGTALFNFGAFLSRAWRENDMLWGKLDAAEIIIRNLLADDGRVKPATVDFLVDEMHRGILNESITPDLRREAYRLVREAIAADPRGLCKLDAVRELIADLGDIDVRMQKVLRALLDEPGLLQFFKETYEVTRELKPKDTLRLAGRVARVVGKMVETLGENSRMKPQAKFLARFASGLWALVEISVPRSFAWNEARHIRALFYFVGIVLVGIGMLWHPALAPGAVILGATLTLHVITAWLHVLMEARDAEGREFGRWLLIGIATVIVGLASWKGIELASRFQRWANKSAPASVTP